MDDEKHVTPQSPEDQEPASSQSPEPEKPSYTPASRRKRIAAWIGIIFMVLLVLLYSYSLSTGAFLNW